MKCKHCDIEIFEDKHGEWFHNDGWNHGLKVMRYSYCSSARYHGQPRRTFDIRLRAEPLTKEDTVQRILDKL